MEAWESTYANTPLCATAEAPRAPEVACSQPDNTFNLEEMLPLDEVRVHTKTDDIPSVTDAQLALYRRAALESAEQYTGYVFSGIRTIQQPLSRIISKRDVARGYFTEELEHPVSNGIIHTYGAGPARQYPVKAGATKVRIPVTSIALDVSSACCAGACDGDLANPGMTIMYQTGFKNICDVPAGIKLGMLKFIAWCITHPGDEITAVRNRTITRSSLVDGTNNIAWASGAIELWRQYDPDYI